MELRLVNHPPCRVWKFGLLSSHQNQLKMHVTPAWACHFLFVGPLHFGGFLHFQGCKYLWSVAKQVDCKPAQKLSKIFRAIWLTFCVTIGFDLQGIKTQNDWHLALVREEVKNVQRGELQLFRPISAFRGWGFSTLFEWVEVRFLYAKCRGGGRLFEVMNLRLFMNLPLFVSFNYN